MKLRQDRLGINFIWKMANGYEFIAKDFFVNGVVSLPVVGMQTWTKIF